jgi:hypothetical protein
MVKDNGRLTQVSGETEHTSGYFFAMLSVNHFSSFLLKTLQHVTQTACENIRDRNSARSLHNGVGAGCPGNPRLCWRRCSLCGAGLQEQNCTSCRK